jgi:hypothetical protein
MDSVTAIDLRSISVSDADRSSVIQDAVVEQHVEIKTVRCMAREDLQ